MEKSQNTDTIIVTASDAPFFPMCLGLILSIKSQAHPERPTIGVLDVGLSDIQRNVLRGLSAQLVTPDWDFVLPGRIVNFPKYFRAMTARPHLPKYFPGYEIYLWLDSDAWVQDWTQIEKTIEIARCGDLAIVRERYNSGEGVAILANTQKGPKREVYTADNIKKAVTDCYKNAFGQEIADELGDSPSYNTGVFALKGSSDTWRVWGEYLSKGLGGGFNHLVEQQALNVAIHKGDVPFTALPWHHNFLCMHALPEIDLERKKLVTPEDKGEIIGVVHLGDIKRAGTVPLRVRQNGEITEISLQYLSLAINN